MEMVNGLVCVDMWGKCERVHREEVGGGGRRIQENDGFNAPYCSHRRVNGTY